ncbi:MAG: Lrp/AsnC family transcriptional regulator, partial [Pedobacter sp.]
NSLPSFVLELLQIDSQITIKKLSELVYQSTSNVRKTIKRLCDDGYITNFTVKLNKAKVGISLTFIAEISLKRNTAQDIEEFKRIIISIPSAIQCWHVNDRCDFVVLFGVTSGIEYEKILNESIRQHINVKKISSMSGLEEVIETNNINLNHLRSL